MAALSLALMTLDHDQHHMATVRAALALAAYPVRQLVNLPIELAQWWTDNLTWRDTLARENAALRAQQLRLSAKLQRLAALEAENARLRELRASSARLREERVLIAEILATDLDPYRHQMIIDKGSSADVYLGQPVLDAYGVMGQTVRVGMFSAAVTLLTDPSHAVPVQVNRNGLRSIAVGSGRFERLELPYLTNKADVRPGDLLVTSGLGGRFPAGYPVGEVIDVIYDPSRPFATVTARPRAHLERSRELLLVWSPQPTEQEPSADELEVAEP